MEKLSVLISDQLIKCNYIKPEYRDAYIYCYDYIIENFKYNISIIIIGSLLNRFEITILFIIPLAIRFPIVLC